MRLSGTTSFVVCPLADTRTLSCDFVRVTVEDVKAQVYLSTQQQRAFLQITVELRPPLLHKYHHYMSWRLVGCTFYLIWKGVLRQSHPECVACSVVEAEGAGDDPMTSVEGGLCHTHWIQWMFQGCLQGPTCGSQSPASRPRKQVLPCLNIIYIPFASTGLTGPSFFQHSHPGVLAGSSVFTAMHIPHANLGVFPIPPHSPRSHFHHPHEALAAATSISAAMYTHTFHGCLRRTNQTPQIGKYVKIIMLR